MAVSKYLAFGRGAGWLPIAPKSVPSFAAIAEDIGASALALAAHLGCSERLVKAWASGERECPRVVLLAMFYESKWGRSFVNCAAENDARMFGEAMLWLRAERARLLDVLDRLGQIGDFGSANDPVPEVRASGSWVSRFDQRRHLDDLPLPLMPPDGRASRPVRGSRS